MFEINLIHACESGHVFECIHL